MSHPMHHPLAKDRIDAMLRQAEKERMARGRRHRWLRRPDDAEPGQER